MPSNIPAATALSVNSANFSEGDGCIVSPSIRVPNDSLHHSPADPFHFEAELFEFGHDSISLVALNLDPAILDGAAGATALLELGRKLQQRIFVQRYIEHDRYALATPSR